MIHQHTRTKVFERLIASLQSAERGSRELDIIVSFILGDTSGNAGKMIHLLVEEGYPWDVISELLDEDLVPYTTSLDAAVPGERIVMTLYSARRSKWAAVHKTAADDHTVVWAATESLARRAAALKVLRPDLRRPERADEGLRGAGKAEIPDTPVRPAGAIAGLQRTVERDRSTPREEPDEVAPDTEGEWKILF